MPPLTPESSEGINRRDFLQAVGAALAAAGLAGCPPPPAEILPYTKRPEGLVPGNPLHFATGWSLDGRGSSLLVASREGRPIKIEGNPEHPINLGAAGALDQAALLGLYDPDRTKQITESGRPLSQAALLAALQQITTRARHDGGARVRFLVEPSASPLLASIRAHIGEILPRARFVAYSPCGDDAHFAGMERAFGRPLAAHPRVERAHVILSLDDDFLASHPYGLRHARAFAERRDPTLGAAMNRLYVVETRMSVTGINADHRIPLRGARIPAFALALFARLAEQLPALAPVRDALGSFAAADLDERLIRALARDLVRAGSNALVLAGLRQPPEVHALVAAMNHALGAVGNTITYSQPIGEDVATGPNSIAALVNELRAGTVDTVIITAWNPVYSAPADLDLAAALRRAHTSIYLAPYHDETAPHARFVVPAAHFLESWGDLRAPDGTVTFAQPLIAPLFHGLSAAELLAGLLPAQQIAGYELLRAAWRAQRAGDFDLFWDSAIRLGFVAGTAAPAVPVVPDWAAIGETIREIAARPTQPTDAIELSLHPDNRVWDGRFANNPWLQELPDPITSITWDNALLLGPKTAARLGLHNEDVVAIVDGARQIDAPILIAPGQAEGTGSLTLGYDREGAESNARGRGANAYRLRTVANPWIIPGVTIKSRGKKYPLARTQEHVQLEGRTIALQQTLAETQSDPERLAHERDPLPSMYPDEKYDGHKWGMGIDLNRCVGCGACVVACVAENNVPWVGKEQVKKGREMHWLRVDRYQTGEGEQAGLIPEPMFCVHCEKAPCEYVCPVNATVHSDEGLNEMVYNRCIGTRYCSNNCPYKVRRFNYFDYHDDRKMLPVIRMAQNPEVTVRSRGVMEKCTYCVQRIESARIEARVAGRSIGGDEIKTACQQTCPSQAIVFGDLNDPRARALAMHKDRRAYEVLHELNTKPRTRHLARVKNPNPEL